jgi:hypothetical protein
MRSDARAPAPARRDVPRRPRLGALALALVLLVFVGAIVTALFSARRIEGAVPGKGGLLSVAATGAGFVVGTTTGAFSSPDGRRWTPVEGLAGPAPVATDGQRVVGASDRTVLETTDLRTTAPLATLPTVPTALASGRSGGPDAAAGSPGVPDEASGGAVYGIDRSGQVVRVDGSSGGEAVVRLGTPGPESPLGLAVVGSSPPVLYAASLGTGLWRSDDGGAKWSRLLATPAQAILPDAGTPDRILLGTPGGLLVTRDRGRSWNLTTLQGAIRGITRRAGRYYVLTEDRLLLESPDGERDWEPLVHTSR